MLNRKSWESIIIAIKLIEKFFSSFQAQNFQERGWIFCFPRPRTTKIRQIRRKTDVNAVINEPTKDEAPVSFVGSFVEQQATAMMKEIVA